MLVLMMLYGSVNGDICLVLMVLCLVLVMLYGSVNGAMFSVNGAMFSVSDVIW